MANDRPAGRRLLVVSGSSGAGKSVVLNTLEDLDYYCIDNLPITLLEEVPEHVNRGGVVDTTRIAVGIDARSILEGMETLQASIDRLRQAGIDTEIVFLDADDEVLTKRFSETRRKHPLTSGELSLADAINDERKLLGRISELAALHVDTSFTTVHELRELVRSRIARENLRTLSIQLMSFGFKHGTPRDADFIFDVRCLPNPHWDKNLRQLSGRDSAVIDYLDGHDSVGDMLSDITAFMERWIPVFSAENRSYLTIAVGCTGGHHRSVYMVEKMKTKFSKVYEQLIVRHRDL